MLSVKQHQLRTWPLVFASLCLGELIWLHCSLFVISLRQSRSTFHYTITKGLSLQFKTTERLTLAASLLRSIKKNWASTREFFLPSSQRCRCECKWSGSSGCRAGGSVWQKWATANLASLSMWPEGDNTILFQYSISLGFVIFIWVTRHDFLYFKVFHCSQMTAAVSR